MTTSKILVNLFLFQDKIKEHNLENTVNVIHLSDHGLTAVTPLEFVNVTQYLTQGTYITEGASPCMQIIAKEGTNCYFSLY